MTEFTKMPKYISNIIIKKSIHSGKHVNIVNYYVLFALFLLNIFNHDKTNDKNLVILTKIFPAISPLLSTENHE